MMSSNNQMSKEQFINQISHPRKREMATMILDGATFEELQAQNFSKVNVQEMVAKIKVYVEGLQNFKVGGETAVENTDLGQSESGPSESGPSESGPNESGPSESGPNESGPSESGPSDSGSSESKSLV